MSRHLMAKMRRSAAKPVEWQHGVVLPDTAENMAEHNSRAYRNHREWLPEDVSTAYVNHGEKMHALQVSKDDASGSHVFLNGDPNPWNWSIKVLRGDDPNEPGHWQWLDEVSDDELKRRGEDPELAEWGDGNVSGQMHTKSEEGGDGTDGGYWSYAPTREHAMRAAENAWERYVGQQTAQRDHNLDVGLGDRGGHSLGDEDYGDIFGGG